MIERMLKSAYGGGMDVAISGASGLIGRALTASLEADGHRVVPLVRPGSSRPGIRWNPVQRTIDQGALEGLSAVVNLAGQGIAARPWTQRQRRAIRDSRVDGTHLVAQALGQLRCPPQVFVSGSAIGYYGSRGDEVLSDGSAPGEDFLAAVCQEWEGAASDATSAGIRTVLLRTGVVLSPRGGALGPQRPLFRVGLGARAGRGEQWVSWIHLNDEVRAIRYLIDTPEVSGAVNLVAPNPVKNAEFARAFAASLGRKAGLRVPRLATRAPFGIGPLVENLLFASQRAVPERLVQSGFTFLYNDLAEALADLA
jgi:uncharacterized protein (TIGR01777 family)